MKKMKDKLNAWLAVGTGGGFGLAAFASACAGVCGASLLPAFLASIGLGGLSLFLASLKIPLLVASGIFGLLLLFRLIQQKRTLGSAITALLLGGFMTYSLTTNTGSTSTPCCDKEKGSFSQTAERVLRTGIYPLWPELGRAPSAEELSEHLDLPKESVVTALEELDGNFVNGIELYKGTHNILFAWPFSSLDHGIRVTLEGQKEVYARCAVDALGMSSMFKKKATIIATTPIEKQVVRFEIDGEKLLTGDSKIIVSYGEKDCDNILFFGDEAELRAYESRLGKKLNTFTLEKAIARGIYVFGKKLQQS